MEGFPGVLLVVKNLPTDAGDTGSMLGGNITLAEGQPSTLATTSEPMCWEPVLCSKRSPTMRSPRTAVMRSRCLLQREKALTQQQRPSTAKSKQTNNVFNVWKHRRPPNTQSNLEKEEWGRRNHAP